MPRKITKVVSGKRRIQTKAKGQTSKRAVSAESKKAVRKPATDKTSASIRQKVDVEALRGAKADPTLSSRRIDEFWQRIPFPHAELKLEARRPDDLLVFTLRVKNLKIASNAPPRLIKTDPNKDSTLIIELPAQHFAEEAFLDATGPEVTENNPDPHAMPFQESSAGNPVPNKNEPTTKKEAIGTLPAARMRIAGPSRLAFTMPEGETTLALDFTAVLAAAKNWPMRLSSLAVPAPIKWIAQASPIDWLKEMSAQSAWQQSIEIVLSHVSNTVSEASVNAIKNSADNVLNQLARGAAGTRLSTLLDRELTTLQKRYSGLRQTEMQEFTQLLMALYITPELATSRGDLLAELIDTTTILQFILFPHQPPDYVTALELPYRLITTPLPKSHWRHSEQAVTHNQRVELWHTRLSSAITDGKTTAAPIRAIWSPDYELDGIIDAVNSDPPKPFRMSLDPVDREMLVKVMAGFNLKQASLKRQKPDYFPLPAMADRLMLSSMGGLLDAQGSWNADHLPAGVGVEQWKHLTALGRDQYVRVVYSGALWPCCHAASLIKVTERKFENYADKLSQRVAVLRQRFFIVVREVEREYTGTGHDYEGRNFPFKSIKINTRVTPNLRPPEQSAAQPATSAPGDKLFNSLPMRTCFWPMISANTDFEFDITATDLDNKETSFSMPLLFVGIEANQEIPGQVLRAYNAASNSRRSADLSGSPVCYAPLSSDPQANGDPRFPTGLMRFNGAPKIVTSKNEPKVYPEMQQAEIGILAVQRMLNNPDAKLTVVYPELYNLHGFGQTSDTNMGELFLEAVTPFSLGFGESSAKSDSLGAIASPGMDISGLSRRIGSVADAQKVASNTFDPVAFFKDAKILGGISVAELLSMVSHLDDAPKMLNRELPNSIEASFDWNTEITKSDLAEIFVHSANGAPTEFSMKGRVITPTKPPTDVTYSSQATLSNFKINLFGFIIIWFDSLEFTSNTGSKADVVVALHPESPTEKAIAFGGPLEFVNELSDIIPMDGFSDPPNISVSPSGLTASYSLAIPSIQVGIFALVNMSIGAGFSLPFNNEPMQVRFNFSERESPFSLTVSLFGGGGFFAIGIGTEGVNEIEAALEFGAAIAIDLGVASGGVEVKAGVYFHWQQESVELTGYVRLHGELAVMGLISASLTFNLQLSYLKQGKKSLVWGEASLIIEVDVLLFSGSVEVHCKREFGGSPSDPTFLELIPDASVWADYCGAFALEEAA